MMLKTIICLALICLLGVSAKQWQNKRSADDMGPLFDYVNKPDSNYKWEFLPQYNAQGLGYKVLYLNMTSQRWLTDLNVSRSIWFHYMALLVPDNLNSSLSNNALMYIGGGGNGDHPPTIWDKEMILGGVIAKELGVVVAMLYNIPNEPIKFYEEKPTPKSRDEDALIAWTWRHFLDDTSNPEWLARLPMTKAAVRGLDTASAAWQQLSGNALTSWIVAGASKRGWTTWTLAAVDSRIIAAVPMVLDELNFVKNIHHHYRSYGGWSFALEDYWALNITADIDVPATQTMMDIIDPIMYTDVITMPKLILSTAGDEFLLPDNVDYFWSELQGESHFRLFPNLEHTMIENLPEVVETIAGFAAQVMSQQPRPEYVWSKTANGTIVLDINPANPPSKVQLWTAYTIDNSTRRDFRLVAIMPSAGNKPWLHPVFWSPSTLQPTVNNGTDLIYEAYVDEPEVGWVGFVVEFEFPAACGQTMKFSTAPSILPQTFPYPDCYLETCQAPLV